MDIILRIIGITLRYRWHLAGAYACTVGASAAYLLLPKFIGRAVDGEGAVLSMVLIIIGLYIARGVLSFGQTYLGEALSQIVAYDLRNAFYDHVQRLSFRFHDQHHTGDLMSRAIVDVEAVRMFINMGLVRTPYYVGLFVAVAAALLLLDWQLGLVSISFLPLVAYQSVSVRLRIRRIWLSIQEKMAELSTVLQENLTGVRVVKAFAAEEYEEAKFDDRNVDVADTIIEAERLRSSNTAYMVFTFLGALGLVLWFGGWRVINGHMTFGELAQFIIYMQMLAMPVRMAGWMANSYARAASAGQRLFEILDTTSGVRESPNARRLRDVSGRVRFENVRFSYNGSLPVLRGIDFDAEPGKVVALLGPPGSGKSTIANLIPRFYDASSGRVTVDGTDVREFTLASLRRSIGYGAAGRLPIHQQHSREHRVRPRRCLDGGRRPGRQAGASPRLHREPWTGATTLSSESAVQPCRAANASGSPSPGRCSWTRPF